MVDLLRDAEEQMSRRVDAFERALALVRVGRPRTALVEGIYVNLYGTPSRLAHVCSVGVRGMDVIVRPYDPTTVEAVERALHAASLEASPVSDGRVIRLPFPEMSGERRAARVREVRALAEECRVAERRIRRRVRRHSID